jgi:hypothetical protein
LNGVDISDPSRNFTDEECQRIGNKWWIVKNMCQSHNQGRKRAIAAAKQTEKTDAEDCVTSVLVSPSSSVLAKVCRTRHMPSPASPVPVGRIRSSRVGGGGGVISFSSAISFVTYVQLVVVVIGYGIYLIYKKSKTGDFSMKSIKDLQGARRARRSCSIKFEEEIKQFFVSFIHMYTFHNAKK